MVTPLMHRTHHDRREQFHHANYGAVFPLWDHLFSTYRAPPQHFQPGLLLPTGPHRFRISIAVAMPVNAIHVLVGI